MVVLRNSNTTIRESADVAHVFADLLNLEDTIDRDKEHFYVMHINARQQVNLVELVAVGTLNDAPFHPRETFRRAVIEAHTASLLPTTTPQAMSRPQTRIFRSPGNYMMLAKS